MTKVTFFLLIVLKIFGTCTSNWYSTQSDFPEFEKILSIDYTKLINQIKEMHTEVRDLEKSHDKLTNSKNKIETDIKELEIELETKIKEKEKHSDTLKNLEESINKFKTVEVERKIELNKLETNLDCLKAYYFPSHGFRDCFK